MLVLVPEFPIHFCHSTASKAATRFWPLDEGLASTTLQIFRGCCTRVMHS